jgi:23S rRNA (guanosine2251-2'-O)-methyltransferase
MKDWIWGRNPVYEALRAGKRKAFQLRLAKGIKSDGRVGDILRLADRKAVPVSQVSRDSLDGLSRNHQGVALHLDEYPYADLSQILELAKQRNEQALVLILDTLKDPQNLGTLIRTGELVGVHGLVLPLRRTATVTPAVVNASSGASEHLLICQANLAQTITQLKENGIWVVGLEGGEEAQPPDKVDLGGPLAVVVGSESEGMRHLVKTSCDFLLQLPMRGRIDSLNAAVAGSVALYLIWQARGFKGAKN